MYYRSKVCVSGGVMEGMGGKSWAAGEVAAAELKHLSHRFLLCTFSTVRTRR